MVCGFECVVVVVGGVVSVDGPGAAVDVYVCVARSVLMSELLLFCWFVWHSCSCCLCRPSLYS